MTAPLRLAGSTGSALIGTTGSAVARAVPRDFHGAGRIMLDLHPRRLRRRVWTRPGRAHIEVRGLGGRGGQQQRLAASVRRSVSQVKGVRWAEVNAVTGQVLVAFDERRVDMETLLDTVRKVEHAHGTRDEEFGWSRPIHPADPLPVMSAAVELAADVVAAGAGLIGRFTPVPPVPSAVRAGAALLDIEPALRRRIKRQVGPINTDVVLSLTSAAVQGLSQNPVLPTIDAVYRAELLAEVLARRSVWRRREAELVGTPENLPQRPPAPPPRPGPRPRGPIESWAQAVGPGALVAAGTVLALTSQPRRAADAILAAVPKPAKLGREGFATVLGWQLARRGVVPLNPGAFRRLDRVDAVIIDSALLCSHRPQILDIEPASGVEDIPGLWHDASRLLRECSYDDVAAGTPRPSPGMPRPSVGTPRLVPQRSTKAGQPTGATRLALMSGRRRLAWVTVGRELTSYADALVESARSSGARVLLTDDASVADLHSRIDDVLGAHQDLAHHVRDLQRDGRCVLVVAGADDDALAAADVGISVLEPGAPFSWAADIVCGPDAFDAWYLLEATGRARPVSERAVAMGKAATALGELLALVGGGHNRSTHATAPVHSAALVALLQGSLAGLEVSRRTPPPPAVHVPWHAMEPEDVLERLTEARAQADRRHDTTLPLWLRPAAYATAAAGQALRASVQAADRLPGAGLARRSVTPARTGVALTRALREELNDPLTSVLVLGAAASAVVGSGVDAALVASVMGGNALISGGQRLRAENALRSLFAEQAVQARRLRTHRDVGTALSHPDDVPLEEVTADQLRPGDVIRVGANDIVPADARLLTLTGLEVDESTLTGESVPVLKDVAATPGAVLGDRRGMVYEGTTVVAGSAFAVVVATGAGTEAGRATRAAGRAAPAAGIQERLGEVTRTALPLTAIGGGAVTGLGLLRGVPLRGAVAAGVSVAVAAVPEGLPLVATVGQASAARRLSRRGTLARSSRALEALGRVDTMCFDKTGTLTEGRLEVTRLAGLAGDHRPGSRQSGELLALAARACPVVDQGEESAVPHATDRAILEAAIQAGVAPDGPWELDQELPFEASRGYSAALGREAEARLLAVKGAPEVVLPLCSRIPGGQAAATREVQRLASEGLRVLAVARRRTGLPEQVEDLSKLVKGLQLVGFVGLADTARPEAAKTVRRLIGQGVNVVMLTGDHPLTATAIARQVGVPAETVLTGDDLDRMTEKERVRRVPQATVFARVSPEHKVQVVEALRASGRVLAMTGDGTNDAAAIRLADVGIGTGAAGSSSARSAADLVLGTSDISRIPEALVEGRQLWTRVRDAVAILVGGNAGEVAFMVLGTALGGRAPIGTRQLLLVNMFTDMFPALAVAVAERPDDQEAASRPMPAPLGGDLAREVAIRGAATALGGTTAWAVGRLTGRHARASSMGLAAVVGTQLGQTLLTNWRSPLVVATSMGSAAALVAVIETPGVSQFFGCTPLGPFAWGTVLASSAGATALAGVAPETLARLTESVDRSPVERLGRDVAQVLRWDR